MPTSYKQMLEAAHAAVPAISAADAAALVEKQGALIVDVRDGTEVAASGKAKGAVAVARGSLESRADPNSPEPQPGIPQGPPRYPLLRRRRPRCACRQDPEGHGLHRRPQPRRIQGLGGRRRRDRTSVSAATSNTRLHARARTSRRHNPPRPVRRPTVRRTRRRLLPRQVRLMTAPRSGYGPAAAPASSPLTRRCRPPSAAMPNPSTCPPTRAAIGPYR